MSPHPSSRSLAPVQKVLIGFAAVVLVLAVGAQIVDRDFQVTLSSTAFAMVLLILGQLFARSARNQRDDP